MANTPAPAAKPAEKEVAAKVATPGKRKYKVINGKTFIRDADGKEIRADIGDYIMLTDAEAKGRINQVELYVPEVDSKAKNEEDDE